MTHVFLCAFDRLNKQAMHPTLFWSSRLVRVDRTLVRLVSTITFNLLGPAPMLIDHDFDWETDLEESPRSGIDRAPANGRGPDSVPHRPGGPVLPSEQVIIIERRRGFSRSTLILALVALALSAISRIPRTAHPKNATSRSITRASNRSAASPREPITQTVQTMAMICPSGRLEQSAWPRVAVSWTGHGCHANTYRCDRLFS